MTRNGRLVEGGGRPNKGREWTRPEGEGVEPPRTNNLEGEKNGDPAPRTRSRPPRPFGGNFAGEDGRAKGSRGAPIVAVSERGPVRGESPSGGGRDRQLQECGGAGHAEGRSERLVPQRPGGRRHSGPVRPAAPRGRGRHSSGPFHHHPTPSGFSPRPPERADPAGARPSPDRDPSGSSGPGLPAPTPQPPA